MVPQAKRSRGGGGDAISRNMRGSDVVLSIPEHVKWHIVYLVEILKFAPHIIAQTELSFGKNRSGTVALCSVYRIVHCYHKYGDVSKPAWAKKYRAADKMPDVAIAAVKNYIATYAAIYLDEIQTQLKSDGHGDWSLSSVYRACRRDLDITWKVLHRRACQRDDAARAAFLTTLWQVDPNDLIFIDECGCDRRNTRRMRGRALRGLPAYVGEFFARGRRINIIGACDVNGFIEEACMQVVDDTVDGATVRDYLWNYLLPALLKRVPGKVVVADNARIHHVVDLEGIVARAGCFVLWLSTYSCDFNPIEEGWQDLKQWIRRNRALFGPALGDCGLVRLGLEEVSCNMRAHFRNCHIDI